MVLKRKRNLKIDANTNYSVFFLKELVPENIEDYVENRDTGMEADEEKEIHLQNIIKGSEKSIPLPVIVEVDNVSRNFYIKKTLHKHINWKGDCQNEYIETEEDKNSEKEIISELGSEKVLSKDPSNINVHNTPNQPANGNAIGLETPSKIAQGFDTTELTVKDPIKNLFGKVGQYQNIELGHSIDLKNNNSLDYSYGLNSPSLDDPEGQSISLDKRIGMLKIDSSSSFFDSNMVVASTLPRMIYRVCDNKNNILGKSDKIINYCLRRAIIRYEKAGFEPYACFRDRIFHPTFKSRRNETLMLEKIGRMRLEFSTLKNLCSLLRDKSVKDLEILKKTHNIVKLSSKLNKNRKKRISKMLSESIVKPRYSHRIDIHSIMTDREKIYSLRNTRKNTDLIIDIKFYEDVMKLVADDSD